MRFVPFFAIALLAAACCKGSDNPSSAPSASAGSPPSAVKPAKAGDGLVDVDLKPLALKIRVPAGGMGAMDMSIGDEKSVTVDIGDGSSLNISEAHGDFASVKKSYKADTILFPFKKWVREEPNLAIEQFENDGKVGYIGIAFKEIGGKKYVCKTTGLEGVPSEDVAARHLKFCDNLAAQ
jgi:hypothetical protein